MKIATVYFIVGLFFLTNLNAQDTLHIKIGRPKKDKVSILQNNTPPMESSSSPKSEVTTIYKVVDVMPLFPGCENISDTKNRRQCANEKLLEFIYSNLQYPQIAEGNGVEGTVVIRFIVDKNGAVVNARIVKDIGSKCGREALRIANLMNSMDEKWTPGRHRGKNVDISLDLPVKFRIKKDR